MAKQKTCFLGKSLDSPINSMYRKKLGEHPIADEDRDIRIRYLVFIIDFIPDELIDLPEFADEFDNKALAFGVSTYACEILELRIRQKWRRKLIDEEYLEWRSNRPNLTARKTHDCLTNAIGKNKGLSWKKHKLKRAFLFFDCVDLILTVIKSYSTATIEYIATEYIAPIADSLVIDAPLLLLYIQKHVQNNSDPVVDYKNIYHDICVLSKKLSNQNITPS
jgi:hypothetical protein